MNRWKGTNPAIRRRPLVRGAAWSCANSYGRQDDPPTLAVLQRQVEAKQAQEAESQRKQRADFEARRKAAAPVTSATLLGTQAMTLREAAEVVEGASGRIEAKDGRLVVYLPGNPSRAWLNAASVLYSAEVAVCEALRGKRPLPDRQVTPNGALV